MSPDRVIVNSVTPQVGLVTRRNLVAPFGKKTPRSIPLIDPLLSNFFPPALILGCFENMKKAPAASDISRVASEENRISVPPAGAAVIRNSWKLLRSSISLVLIVGPGSPIEKFALLVSGVLRLVKRVVMTAILAVEVKFYPYADMRHKIRLRAGRVYVHLSDIFKDAPANV